MFNLFKKKEPKADAVNSFMQLRSNYMGNAPLNEWPKDNLKEQPWAMFVDAREKIAAKNLKEAEAIYRQILETPGLETRHYMQAWMFLRYFLKVQPSADIAKKVYAVMVEVVTPTGLILVVGFADHSARIIHTSGGGAIWEKPDTSLDEKIDTLLNAGEQALKTIPLTLTDVMTKPPAQMDLVSIHIATPSGIYQGMGPGQFMSQDPTAGPILSASTDLLQSLQNKGKP